MIKEIVKAVKVAEFVPKSGVRIATTDAEADAMGSQAGEFAALTLLIVGSVKI